MRMLASFTTLGWPSVQLWSRLTCEGFSRETPEVGECGQIGLVRVADEGAGRRLNDAIIAMHGKKQFLPVGLGPWGGFRLPCWLRRRLRAPVFVSAVVRVDGRYLRRLPAPSH